MLWTSPTPKKFEKLPDDLLTIFSFPKPTVKGCRTKNTRKVFVFGSLGSKRGRVFILSGDTNTDAVIAKYKAPTEVCIASYTVRTKGDEKWVPSKSETIPHLERRSEITLPWFKKKINRALEAMPIGAWPLAAV